MPRLKMSPNERAGIEVRNCIKSVAEKRGYRNARQIAESCAVNMGYQSFARRLASPVSMKFEELLQSSLSLRMQAEDFGEMCRKAYAEFKTY